MKIFLTLAVLLTIQSALSLRGGFTFLRLVRRSRKTPPGGYHPPSAVIVPCKGDDEDLAENAARFFNQDYPSYQIIFVVASRDDPAHWRLANLLAERQRPPGAGTGKASLVVAGLSDTNGEKVNNLLAGLKAVEPEVEALAFADIDARPRAGWLRSLIAPLGEPGITMSTGFRWYLPGRGFTSRLQSAWDASIATMMGEHNQNFAWGGSMAIRRADFERLQVAERYWRMTVSDDYCITRAVRDAGGGIHFEPRCLVATSGGARFGEFLRWANRQIIITRVYASRFWKLGLASYSLYAITFVWGLALIARPRSVGSVRATAAAFLIVVLALGTAKGALRSVAARELFPEEKETIGRYASCYWRLAWLVPWVMFFNFSVAGFIRRIEWRGAVYDLCSAKELRVVRRGGS
ncbi:MAG: glycosyltransferase [Terriglobia bacterium]